MCPLHPVCFGLWNRSNHEPVGTTFLRHVVAKLPRRMEGMATSKKEKESFLEAAWRGDLDEVRDKAAHAPDATDAKGRTAAHLAAARKDAATLDFLVRCGADADACDARGVSPAHVATSAGRLDALSVLQRAGADLWCEDERDDTPLHVAARLGRSNVVEWLLRQGADGRATNVDGLTPLMELLLRCVDFEHVPRKKPKAAERGRQCLRNWFAADVGRHGASLEDGSDVLAYGDEEDEAEDVLRSEGDAFQLAERLADAAGPSVAWKVQGHDALALAEALERPRAMHWIRKRRSAGVEDGETQTNQANEAAVRNGSTTTSTTHVEEVPVAKHTHEDRAWKKDVVSDVEALRAERSLLAAVHQLHEDEAFQQAMRREEVRQAVAEVADDPRAILRWSHHPDAMVALNKLRQLQELRRKTNARKVALEELLVVSGQEDATRRADERAAKDLRRALKHAKRTVDHAHGPSEIQPAPPSADVEAEADGLTWRQVFRTTLLQLLYFVLFLLVALAVQRWQASGIQAAKKNEL